MTQRTQHVGNFSGANVHNKALNVCPPFLLTFPAAHSVKFDPFTKPRPGFVCPRVKKNPFPVHPFGRQNIDHTNRSSTANPKCIKPCNCYVIHKVFSHLRLRAGILFSSLLITGSHFLSLLADSTHQLLSSIIHPLSTSAWIKSENVKKEKNLGSAPREFAMSFR